MTARHLSALSIFIAMFAFTTTATAQFRVAVAPFDGNGAAAARRQVQRALGDDHRVALVDLDRVDSAAERSGAGATGSDGISELAESVRARLIVQGVVRGRGRRRSLRLTARDENGQQIGSADGSMRGNGVANAVMELLDNSLGRLPPEQQRDEEAPPSVGRRDETEEEEHERPGGNGDDDEDLYGDDDGDSGGGGTGGADMRQPIVNVQVGVIPRSRDVDIAFEDAHHGVYEAWYPEIGARAEIRPFAQSTDLLRGLFGRFDFGYGVGLSSRIESTDTEVESTFWRLGFDIGMLFPLADIFDLGLAFGMGWDSYNMADNPLLESAEYLYFRPAARGQIKIYREMVVLNAELGFRGAAARGNFDRYGIGDSLGLDIGGGISGAIPLTDAVGLTYGVDFVFQQYFLTFFDGVNAGYIGLDGVDRAIRIGLFVGVGIW